MAAASKDMAQARTACGRAGTLRYLGPALTLSIYSY